MQLKPRRARRAALPAAQRGMSLVELMVGIVIGLIVVAAASMVMANNTVDNRRLVVEAQLQQDLRATADIITREIRRAGATNDINTLESVWHPNKVGAVLASPRALPLTPAVGVTASEVSFAYNPGLPGTDGVFGFKLESGVIRTKLVAGGWQDLTDSRAMRVLALDITRLPDSSIVVPCPKACSDGTAGCWPTVNVRAFTVAIRAQAVGVPGVERSISSRARLRNDYFRFADGSTTQVCPT